MTNDRLSWLPQGRNRIVAIGDVIDDILVRPFGQIRLDTDTPSQIRQLPGGSGANFASWLASDLQRLGASSIQVEFVGRVATADLDRHQRELERNGVIPRLQADEELPTGCIVVLVQGETRTFLTERGANQNLSVSELVESDLSEIALLYLSGYSITDSLTELEARQVLERAQGAGCVTMCDPGSAGFIDEYGPAKFLDIARGADFFLPSREEALLLTGEANPIAAAEALAIHFGLVIVTLGSGGVALAGGIEPARIVETTAVDAIDATGAGDAFAAGFVASLCTQPGGKIEDHIRAGSNLARAALAKSGGRPT